MNGQEGLGARALVADRTFEGTILRVHRPTMFVQFCRQSEMLAAYLAGTEHLVLPVFPTMTNVRGFSFDPNIAVVAFEACWFLGIDTRWIVFLSMNDSFAS